MGTPNFRNRTLYYGDNLPALRRMNSETVHLIATDPPFKKQRGFFSDAGGYDDRWTWRKDILGLDRKGNAVAENHDDWVDQIQDDWPGAWKVIDAARAGYGDDMGAFLCWLGVRLMEMRRILREDGSIYVHLDETAVHYVTMLMDAIFGRENRLNGIVWRRTYAHGGARRWASVHDTILFYRKSENHVWNPVYVDYDKSYLEQYYRFEDEKGRYQLVSLTGAGITKAGDSGLPWRGVNPSNSGRHWAVPMPALRGAYPGVNLEGFSTQEKLDLLDAAGLVYWPKRGSVPRQKRYADENPGTPIADVIDDIGPLGAHARERTSNHYPTQKPLALYERIIRASSNPGDVVLDPFCGCATTPVAAERLGRQWVGMDIWEQAYGKVTSRLREYGILVDDSALDGEFNEKGMLQFGEYRLVLIDNKDKGDEFPARTDADEVAAPALNLRRRRPTEPWQQLSNALMRRILVVAQGRNGLVGCAGCGRALEADFFHLDHISPKSQGGENYITNRILICAPCNSRKSDTKTLKGLQNDNRKDGWMKDRRLAEEVQVLARMRAEWIRDSWGSQECRDFVANPG